MNYDIIKKLAEKYYNSQTSLKEERKLKELLFASEELPEELVLLKAEFVALDELAAEHLDDSFDLKVMNTITGNQKGEEDNGMFVFDFRTKRISLVYKLSAVAAAILVLLTVWTTGDFFTSKKVMFDNQKSLLAYQQASRALEILAVNFDKGMSQTRQAVKPINKGLDALGNVEMINKGINTLRPVEKLGNMELVNEK